MISLHNLTPLVKKRKRIGRGGSRGGTSTKGHKGQHARSGGKVRNGFEGGQMPLFRRLPKRGFINSPFVERETKIVNIEALNAFEHGAVVDMHTLIEKGIVNVKKGVKQGFFLKVLGNGTLEKKLTITADAFSESAKKAIESLGGEARLTKEM